LPLPSIKKQKFKNSIQKLDNFINSDVEIENIENNSKLSNQESNKKISNPPLEVIKISQYQNETKVRVMLASRSSEDLNESEFDKKSIASTNNFN